MSFESNSSKSKTNISKSSASNPSILNKPGISKSPPLSELTGRQMQWIGAGVLMTFASQPGQTIFIAQFNTALRETFSLSHGGFGLLYTVATLASSIVLVWGGGLADKIAPKTLALVCLTGLCLVAISMSFVPNVVALGFVLFGLRFFGQGMMGHIAMTTMARWFNRFRGRAISLAQLGFPFGEATLPFIVTMGIAAFGWRQVWLAAAAVLILAIAPMVAFLLRDPPDGKRAKALGIINPDAETTTAPIGLKWTRGAVLRDPMFYLLVPGFMGPPAIGTLFVFHQANLSALKGWDLTTFTAFFPTLSLTGVIAALISGMVIDRYGAWRIVPFVLIPLGIGCISIGLLTPVWSIPLFFMLFGMSFGMMNTTVSALWAEVYGTAHIGAVRALASAAFVSASAIGPGIAGVLIDAGITLEAQSFYYAAFCFVAAFGYLLLHRQLGERVGMINTERAALAAV